MLAPLAGSLRAARPAPEEIARLPPVLRAQLRIHAALLDELERSGFAVAEQRIGLTPLRKLWLAWRATR
jgi:phytoene synthase